MARSVLVRRHSWWIVVPIIASVVASPIVYVATRDDAGSNRGPEAILGGAIVLAILFGLASFIVWNSLRRSALYGRPRWLALVFVALSLAVWPVTLAYWLLGPRPLGHVG